MRFLISTFKLTEDEKNKLYCAKQNMAPIFEHFVRTIILLLTISLCNAAIQSVKTAFTEKKSVATSYTTLQKISKIKCVERCNKDRQNGRCTLAGYNKSTKTCYLSDDDPLDALDTDDEMSGVFLPIGRIKYIGKNKCFLLL